jgi:tetratricopeptide (TPR) repeat protein
VPAPARLSSRIPGAVHALLAFAAIVALAFAARSSVRLARADHQFRNGTPEGAARALALAPDNAAYALRLGRLTGNVAALERAVALEPRLAEAWIELGLHWERDGQLSKAERALEHAVLVDATYAPLWTQANFYARQNQPSEFLVAARRALATGDPDHYNPAPLFQLAWNTAAEPAAILKSAIPRVARIENLYLEFLLANGHLEAAGPAAERLLHGGEVDDAVPLMIYCDRLLEAGDRARAVSIWNALGRMARPSRPPLEPLSGFSLTNGDFSAESTGHGFDWRMPVVPGVSYSRKPRASTGLLSGMRITFDGHQPEQCQTLEQILPLLAGGRYRLRCRYRAALLPAGSGPQWQITDAATGAEIPSDALPLSGNVETETVARFRAPAHCGLARLALVYRRALGTMRIAGTVALESVSLGFEP